MSTIETIKALNSLSKGINPTIIYNEGWMIRLLVIESMIQKLKIEGIDFELLAKKKWSSEALIKSPFVTAIINKEGYTHADIILGDFEVNFENRGEATLQKDNPKILGVIEAKMRSDLSQGTTNAKDYNQASRSVCCLSYMTKDNPDCEIFFIVVAPKTKINKIKNQIEQENIITQIENRFKHSNVTLEKELIQKQVAKCKILPITYEEWIGKLQNNKEEVKDLLNEFYTKCLCRNKVK